MLPTTLFVLPYRERDAGAYGTPAYYTAVLLFDIVPMRVVPPLFFAMFSYWMIGLHTQCTSCIFAFIGNTTNLLTCTVMQCLRNRQLALGSQLGGGGGDK